MTLFLLIAAVLFSLSVSALCSLLEAALLSLTPGQVASIKKSRPKAGAIWERFKADVEKPISVILICNTAAHTIGATVAGAQFEKYVEERTGAGGWPILVFGIVFTVLMLQFTEILPKTLGVKFNRLVAVLSARPMNFLVWIMGPVLSAVRLINKPFEKMGSEQASATEEIAVLAATARSMRQINSQQEKMIKSAARLGETPVKQVMTPRRSMQTIRKSASFAENLKVLRSTPFSRLPVVDGDDNHVVGVVHLKDVFNMLALVPGRLHVETDADNPGEVKAILNDLPGGQMHVIGTGDVDLAGAIRPAIFVPETQTLDLLMTEFQDGASHMAIVVDEYATVQGLVTLEDVLEEIVGEIEDEFDPEEHDFIEAIDPADPAKGYRVQGRAPLADIGDAIEQDLTELAGDVVTLGGYVTVELGRFPNVGDRVSLRDYTVHITKVSDRQVREAKLVPAPPETPGDEADEPGDSAPPPPPPSPSDEKSDA